MMVTLLDVQLSSEPSCLYVGWFAGRLVGRSVIIYFKKAGKLQFHRSYRMHTYNN